MIGVGHDEGGHEGGEEENEEHDRKLKFRDGEVEEEEAADEECIHEAVRDSVPPCAEGAGLSGKSRHLSIDEVHEPADYEQNESGPEEIESRQKERADGGDEREGGPHVGRQELECSPDGAAQTGLIEQVFLHGILESRTEHQFMSFGPAVSGEGFKLHARSVQGGFNDSPVEGMGIFMAQVFIQRHPSCFGNLSFIKSDS